MWQRCSAAGWQLLSSSAPAAHTRSAPSLFSLLQTLQARALGCCQQPISSSPEAYSRQLHTSTGCLSTEEAPSADAAAAPKPKGPSPPPPGMSLTSQRRKARLAYEQRRAAWKRELTALRKEWLREHQQRQEAAERQRQKLVLIRQQEVEANKQQQGADEAAQRQQRLLKELQQAEFAAVVVRPFEWNNCISVGREYHARAAVELVTLLECEHSYMECAWCLQWPLLPLC